MARGWTDDETRELLNLWNNGLSAEEISAKLQRSKKAVYHKLEKQPSDLRGKRLIREIKQVSAKQAWKDVFIEDFIQHLQQAPRYHFTRPTPPPCKNFRPETFCILISDMHYGQVVHAAHTYGANVYNSAVTEQRLHYLRDKIKLIADQAQNVFFDEALILLAGDIVEGDDIYPGQAKLIDRELRHQVLHSSSLLADFTISLLAVFPSIRVVAVPGNHGRGRGKRDENDGKEFDYFVYHFARHQTGNYPEIVWDIAENDWARVEIKGKTIHLEHGDNGRRGGTFTGMLERTADAIRGVAHADIVALGHWHRPCILALSPSGYVVSNGSFCGANAFSVGRLKSALPASQVIWGVNEQGITWHYILYLGEGQ